MQNKFTELQSLVNGLEEDFVKFYEKGNKAAGTRIRKGLKDVKDFAFNLRKEIQAQKNAEGGDAAAAAKAPAKAPAKKPAAKK